MAHGSTGVLQLWPRAMRHIAVMQYIALERSDELIGSAFFKADAVIHTCIVRQRIDSTHFLH